jgi:hypothetical protein
MPWKFRGKADPDAKDPQPVSVSDRFLRMSSEDLEVIAEQSLMAAQESMTRMRMKASDAPFYLDRARINAQQAAEALEALHKRIFT